MTDGNDNKAFLPISAVFSICYSNLDDFTKIHKPAWRNGLARWTSNPKVVGSNPTVGAFERTENFTI